jgi:hypothetical protein
MSNLNPNQFPENYPAGKPLKSKWIPTQTDRRGLKWHILDRHVRYAESPSSTPESPMWGKSDAPPRGKMTDTEYHDHLHSVGFFDKDSEHEHFTPKNER